MKWTFNLLKKHRVQYGFFDHVSLITVGSLAKVRLFIMRALRIYTPIFGWFLWFACQIETSGFDSGLVGCSLVWRAHDGPGFEARLERSKACWECLTGWNNRRNLRLYRCAGWRGTRILPLAPTLCLVKRWSRFTQYTNIAMIFSYLNDRACEVDSLHGDLWPEFDHVLPKAKVQLLGLRDGEPSWSPDPPLLQNPMEKNSGMKID